MKKIIYSVFTLLICFSSYAQGYRIKVKLPEAANQDVLLAHYYNTQIFINDTIKLNNKGKGVFSADTLLPQGLYKIFFNNDNHFDFLLSADQQFTISSPDFSNTNLNISGATETKEFAEYVLFLSGQQQKRREYENNWEDATPEEKKVFQADIDKLTDELYAYWKSVAEKYPDTWLATFLMANYVPEPDENLIPAEIRENDSLLLRYNFNFQNKHFFDYFDVADERFLTTPLLKPKLETYFTKVLFQTYDSVKVGVIDLIEKSRPSMPMFRYITSYFLNESYNSKLMGMDALFVDIAKKYYLSGEASWADSSMMARIRENVIFNEHNLIGMEAGELLLEGIDGEEYFSLHQVDAKITLLLIYEPNCSHCKVFVPELHEKVYLPYKNKGLEVYAVYSMDNKNEWTEFVEEHELFDWINVWDEHHFSNFKITYDARETPRIYVLDENKKIIAKRLTVDQVKQVVEIELGID